MEAVIAADDDDAIGCCTALGLTLDGNGTAEGLVTEVTSAGNRLC